MAAEGEQPRRLDHRGVVAGGDPAAKLVVEGQLARLAYVIEAVCHQLRFSLAQREQPPQPIAADEVPGLAPALTPDGWLRTLPCHWADVGGIDGFFVARFRRRGPA